MKILKNIIILSVLAIAIVSCKKDEEEQQPAPQVIEVNLGSDASLVEGFTITLDAGISGADYQWSTGETSQTIDVDTTGKYWVSVIKGEASGSDTIEITMQYKTIKVETDFGDFRMWLYHSTPLHRQNFLGLTEQNFYDSLIFHRVVYDFVIQGGDPDGTGYGGPGYTIPAEILDELHHDYGAVGAARQDDYYNPERESNGSQFYIVCDPDGEHYLDSLYTVFGFVFSGMDAIFEISQVPVDSVSKRPYDDVFMKNVSIENFTAEELENNFNYIIP